jgi:hypothetical protein
MCSRILPRQLCSKKNIRAKYLQASCIYLIDQVPEGCCPIPTTPAALAVGIPLLALRVSLMVVQCFDRAV